MATPINPIMSMTGSVATPNQTLPTATTTRPLPNYGSTYMPQFLPTASNHTLPMSLPQASSSTMDDGLANLREEMAKMLRENLELSYLGIGFTKSHTPSTLMPSSALRDIRFQILLSSMERAQKPHGSMLVNT